MQAEQVMSRSFSFSKGKWKPVVAVSPQRFHEGRVLTTIEVDAVDMGMAQLACRPISVVAVDDRVVRPADHHGRPVALGQGDDVDMVGVRPAQAKLITRPEDVQLQPDHRALPAGHLVGLSAKCHGVRHLPAFPSPSALVVSTISCIHPHGKRGGGR